MIGLSFMVALFVVTTAFVVVAGFTHHDQPQIAPAPVPSALRPAPPELVAMLPVHVAERGVGMVVCSR